MPLNIIQKLISCFVNRKCSMIFRFSGFLIRFQNVFQNRSELEIYRTYFDVSRSFCNLLEIPDGGKQRQRT